MKLNILKKISYLFLSFALITAFTSCEAEESNADASTVLISEITGTYVVEMQWDGDPQGTSTIIIYNTGANETDFMWLDDLEHSWGLQAKVPLNFGALTFDGSDLEERYYGVTVTITESQIVKGGATAPSGDVVDSITFKAEFSDIPGEIWEYNGYKSTAKIGDLP
jgi:hypothetical protein